MNSFDDFAQFYPEQDEHAAIGLDALVDASADEYLLNDIGLALRLQGLATSSSG
jgi:hypothetical protein